VLSCRELNEQHASDYVDGRLSRRERLAVRLHLALCSNCRRFITQLRLVKSVLRVRPDVSLPDSEAKPLAARLQAALEEQQKNSSG
jgi:anti-sigma factor RsiW